MAGNMILFAFCVMLARWVVRLKLKKNAGAQTVRHALWVLTAVFVFLLVNMFLAVAEYSQMRLLEKLEPVLYESVLQETGNGKPVIIFGTVSADNLRMLGDFVAYNDEQALWSPKGIIIDLDRGSIRISNDTYAALNWPVDAGAKAYLQAGQAITVFGHTGRFTILSGPDRGREVVEVTATDVFAGPVEMYIRHKSVYKGGFVVLLFLNSAGLIYIVSLIVFALIRLRRITRLA
jgi:hypothetical protein